MLPQRVDLAVPPIPARDTRRLTYDAGGRLGGVSFTGSGRLSAYA